MKCCAFSATAGSATRTWSPTSGGSRRRRAHAKLGLVVVGDLSQPRGGPTPSGHRSHQTGLDADIGYAAPPGVRAGHLSRQAREQLSPLAVIDLKTHETTGAWTPASRSCSRSRPPIRRSTGSSSTRRSRSCCARARRRRRRGRAGCARGGPTTITSTCGSSARPTARSACRRIRRPTTAAARRWPGGSARTPRRRARRRRRRKARPRSRRCRPPASR